MRGFVWRRSVISLFTLTALLTLVGGAVVVTTSVPVVIPAVISVLLVLLQYAVGPWVIQWLIPARQVQHDGTTYDTDHSLGRIVAEQCRAAGIPLVRLGIIDDSTPNAFTFGRVRRDAHVYVSRGLLE